MSDALKQLYFEDFAVGQIFDGSERRITQEDVLNFSGLTGDKHPIHYDPDYASKTRFGRPIVHGLHLMSLTAVGATALSEQLTNAMIAFIKESARFRKPVFVDDTITSTFSVAAVEGDAEKPWGHVTLDATLTNQNGDTVLEASHTYRIARRPAAEGKQ